jgi:hypothetical protein
MHIESRLAAGALPSTRATITWTTSAENSTSLRTCHAVQKNSSRSARLACTDGADPSGSIGSVCETGSVASTADISVHADGPGGNLPRVHTDLSTDPLHERRAELIDHYDRHGYPERARYLERQLGGPDLVRRASELGRNSPARAGAAVTLVRDMLAYWTGWSMDAWDDLAAPFAALAGFRAHAHRLESDPRASLDARQRSRALLQTGREACRPLVDTTLAIGLWARVNTYLSPIGAPTDTADAICYQELTALRGFCGSYVPLRIASPGPDIDAPFVIVCDRCSFVDATARAASRCWICAKSRPRPEGALRVPVTHPEMPWLVAGDLTAYVRTCEECGELFVAKRSSARTCSSACRVARARKHATRPASA